MEFFLGLICGTVITFFVLHLMVKHIERRMLEELGQDPSSTNDTKSNAVVATVEIVDNKYFCYSKENSQFICYGNTLLELQEHFRARFPNQGLTLESNDTELIGQLTQEFQNSQKNNQT
jgi:hypothetical protein